MSHPIRVRGLKHIDYVLCCAVGASHPIRVRGLKHTLFCYLILKRQVAPYTGAWIETDKKDN